MESRDGGKESGGQVVSIDHGKGRILGSREEKIDPVGVAVQSVATYINRLVNKLFFSVAEKSRFFAQGMLIASVADSAYCDSCEKPIDDAFMKIDVHSLILSALPEISGRKKGRTTNVDRDAAFFNGVKHAVCVLLSDVKIPLDSDQSLYVEITNSKFCAIKNISLSSVPKFPVAKRRSHGKKPDIE